MMSPFTTTAAKVSPDPILVFALREITSLFLFPARPYIAKVQEIDQGTNIHTVNIQIPEPKLAYSLFDFDAGLSALHVEDNHSNMTVS
jgi:hypothetical protein